MSAAAIERALGLSPGYLSKVRRGSVTASAQLQILLALLARHPLLLRELGVAANAAARPAAPTGPGGSRAINLVRRVAPLLDDAGVRWAVGGAVALALHGLPRQTHDIDVFVRANDRSALKLFREAGAAVGSIGPNTFVIYAKGAAPTDRVDLVFATQEPLRSALAHAERMVLDDVQVPVLRAVDLCAAKLVSHGPHDAVDACAMIEAGLVDALDVRRVLAKVPRLPRSASGHARHHADTSVARVRLGGVRMPSPRGRRT